MVSIIDKAGIEQNADAYIARLVIPPAKQAEISSHVSGLEASLNCLDDLPQPYFWSQENARIWEEFKSRLENFLAAAAYAENVLASHYVASERSFAQMRQWRSLVTLTYNSLTDGSNPDYYLAKMRRLGCDLSLSGEEEKAISKYESHRFSRGVSDEEFRGLGHGLEVSEHGSFKVIKVLSRHKDLGLPGVEDSRRAALEKYLSSIKIPCHCEERQTGLLAAAKRAGLELPPINADGLDWHIGAFIEPVDVKLRVYLSKAHHLRRLLIDPD